MENQRKNVLITGGTGLVGSHLSNFLTEKGYRVMHLSRSVTGKEKFKTFEWDVAAGKIDSESTEKADYIIHLAGANIFDKRWTESRKQEIMESRTKSTRLLNSCLEGKKHSLIKFVSASAVGYYGDGGEKKFTEDSGPGDDFLAKVCVEWEREAKKITSSKESTVINRFGIVFTGEEGALKEMAWPVKLIGVSPIPGSGEQYLSWIHIHDLCAVFLEELEKPSEFKGVYNLVGGCQKYSEVMKMISKVLGKKALTIKMPELFMKLGLGEKAAMITNSTRVEPKRLKEANFEFKFADLEKAMKDLL